MVRLQTYASALAPVFQQTLIVFVLSFSSTLSADVAKDPALDAQKTASKTAVQSAYSVLELVNPKWKACQTTTDCTVVRGGTSCKWNAVNRQYKEEFSKWIGYIYRNKGPTAACPENFKILESDMEISCTQNFCAAKKKKEN